MIVPTKRALQLVAAGLPLSVVPVVVAPRLWPIGVAFLVAVGVLLLLDALLCTRGDAWRIELALPDTLYMGDPDPMEAELSVPTREFVRRVELCFDVDALLAPPMPITVALVRTTGSARRSARVSIPLLPTRRGTAAVEALWLRWHGPFELVRRMLRRSLEKKIAIVPNVRAVHAAALQLARTSAAWAGRKPERFLGDGSEFEALREFQPGFDVRTLDWKASARHATLLCREMRAERNHQLVVALDCGQRMREPIDGMSRLDRAINAALVLTWTGLKHGDRVGLFAFDAEPRAFEPPLAGAASFGRIRRRTAALDASTDASNYTLGLTHLVQKLKRRALVILFTDFADAIGAELLVENVARLARRHVVLFVTLRDPELEGIALAEPKNAAALHRAVAAEDLLRDRAQVLERVARLGVHVLDARAEQVTSRLVNRYLDMKRRELVS